MQSGRIFVTLLSLVSASDLITSSFAQNLPGESLVFDPSMQKVIWNRVSSMDKAQAPTCKKRKVVDTKISQPLGDVEFGSNAGGVRMVEGEWKETWTVDRCGTHINYSIHVTVHKGVADIHMEVLK